MKRSACCGWLILGFYLFTGTVFSPGLAKSGNPLLESLRQDRSGQGQVALKLTRSALEYASRFRDPLPIPPDLPNLLHQRSAVFVSTMIDGKPRCCMGTLIPREPTLAREIITTAHAAAVCDKRFRSIRPSEFKRLRVILSILGTYQPITNPERIDPLQDGLAVRGLHETGVVLPGETNQVKVMIKWGRLRARVKQKEQVQYLRLEVLRIMEPPSLTSPNPSFVRRGVS